MTARGLWLAFLVGAIVLSPSLLVLHRLAVFHTVPYDDYAPYLLWLDGRPGGMFPGSPYGYRVVSMLVALPLLHALAPLPLTNLPGDVPPLWLRATLALNLTNYLALVGACVLTLRTAVRCCGLTRAEGVLAALLLFALAWYTQLTAIDGLALLLIAAAVTLLDRPLAFAALLLASAATNEKVALVIALWLGARVVLVAEDRARLAGRFAVAAALVGLYFATVLLLHLPGNDYQTDAAGMPGVIRANLLAYASPRGVLLNVLPIAVLAGLAGFGHRRAARACAPLFRGTDMAVIAGLAGVALAFTQLFQAGRIVMHAAPLFVIPGVAALREGA